MLELCEPSYSLVDMSAEFYGCAGVREVFTFITEGKKPPALMGFNMNDDGMNLPSHIRTMRQDSELMAQKITSKP